MDIMQLFRGTPATPAAPAPTTPVAGNNGQPLQGTQGGPGTNTDPNGVVPAGSTAPNPGNPGTSSGEPASPLDAFKDIWKNDPTQTPAGPAGVFGNVDPAKLMESAKKVNFSNAVSQEQMQAIAAGGESAVKAFAEAMNSVAQTVYAQSALATTKIVDQALVRAQESYDARIPTMVRKLSANEGLAANSPHLSNPALAPMVEALTEQFTRKNPNATSFEIQAQVNDYFSALGTVLAPKQEQAAPKPGNRAAQETDWDAFMR